MELKKKPQNAYLNDSNTDTLCPVILRPIRMFSASPREKRNMHMKEGRIHRGLMLSIMDATSFKPNSFDIAYMVMALIRRISDIPMINGFLLQGFK